MKKNTETGTIVRLISVDKRYRTNPYPSIPIKDESIGTFLTGQHIDPKDPDTLGNLTLAEMTGVTPLSPEKAKKFPYVIYPQIKDADGKIKVSTFPLRHGDKYDLTREEDGTYRYPRDKAMYDYSQYQYIVAASKEDVQVGVHMFYIENLVAEAEKRNTLADLQFEAESLIRSCSIDQYRDIALLLNYSIKNFNMQVGVLKDSQVKDKLITAAKEHPKEIIECFGDGVEDDLFILKLKERGIISFRGGNFYDGKTFLGQTLDQVKTFMRLPEHSDFVNKWGSLLKR